MVGQGVRWSLYLTVYFGDQLGTMCLGAHWVSWKKFVHATMTFAVFIFCLIGLDILSRPWLWLFRRLSPLVYQWFPSFSSQDAETRLQDCDWRGPGTMLPADAPFFRDHIRARGAKKVPHHILICHEGDYARLERDPSVTVKTSSRNGQIIQFKAVVGASRTGLRGLLEGLDPKRICLCKIKDCQHTGIPLHVQAYAGVDATTLIDFSHRQRSPLVLCVSWLGQSVWRVLRLGHMGLVRSARNACSRLKRFPRRGVKHPDSESEPDGEHCLAECIAWQDEQGAIVSLCVNGDCQDSAQTDPVILLSTDVRYSDVANLTFEGVDALSLIHI